VIYISLTTHNCLRFADNRHPQVLDAYNHQQISHCHGTLLGVGNIIINIFGLIQFQGFGHVIV